MRGLSVIDGANAAALLLALMAAAAIALALHVPTPSAAPASTHDGAVISEVRGSDGVMVPVREWRRIVSVVPQLDEAAAAVGLLERFAGVTAHARAHSPFAAQLAVVPGTVLTGASVEDLLGLRPDLVLVSAFADPGFCARLRSAGIAVWRIGEERGPASCAQYVVDLATLCGARARGETVAATFQQRLQRVADPAWPRRRACYVSIYDARLFGGTVGTSYGEVLKAAGFTDAAALAGFRDWPQYQPEDLLKIAPDVIVTGVGMSAALRALPGAGRVPALAHNRVLELDEDLLSAPGLALLDAAEALAEQRRLRLESAPTPQKTGESGK